MNKITILGSGAWGTAVATVLAHNGYKVTLWCYEKEVAQTIKTAGHNQQYLPDIDLKNIVPTHCLKEALQESEYVFCAIPVKFFRTILQDIKPLVKSQKWVLLNKGIEQETLLLPSQILDEVLQKEVPKVVVSGPSFAKDVGAKQLTGVVAAGRDTILVSKVVTILANEYFLVQQSDDLLGVQLCAALKNVVTVGIGFLDGAGFLDNTKALFFTKSLQEIKQLVVRCGGSQETVDGLAGVGDLVLTAFGKLSRNLAVGRQLGQGHKLNEILAKTKCVPEGVNTIVSVYQLIQKEGLKLPLLDSVYGVVKEEAGIEEFLKILTI